MMTEEQALERILTHADRGSVALLPLAQALDHFSAQEILASVPNPPFDNSAMDGYALHVGDSEGAQPLRVKGEQPAGLDRRLTVERGCAIRIFTGAPLPQGTDAVIMQEDVDVERRDATTWIRCREPVTEGENIRRAGADLCRGQRILCVGERLTPARIGLLASQGIDTVEAVLPPRVAVLTTGDELARPGAALRSGQIHDSNGPMLHALLSAHGISDVTVEHCGDEPADTERILARLVAAHDFIIIAGGVSVGDRDQVKPALRSLGIDPELWRVRIKPGKPFLYCRGDTARSHGEANAAFKAPPRQVHIFGLPGNPVSAFVTFHVFVRPALLHRRGASADEIRPRTALAEMSASLTNRGDRPHYMRGRMADGKFITVGTQQSHALFALSQADALLRLDADESAAAGEVRRVILL